MAVISLWPPSFRTSSLGGLKVTVEGSWLPLYGLLFRCPIIRELYLMDAALNNSSSINSVSKLSNLRGLHLGTFNQKLDLSPIHQLTQLTCLRLSTQDKTPLDFRNFTELRELSIRFREDLKGVFDNKRLESLFFEALPYDDFSCFQQMENLRSLTPLSPKARSVGSLTLPNLRFFEVKDGRRLQCLDGIERAEQLEVVWLNHCPKVECLEPLSKLPKLRSVQLVGCNLRTLKPIKKCRNLEEFFMWESTVADGEVSFIKDLPNIKRCDWHRKANFDV